MTLSKSPELSLTVACCRWPPSPERESAVRDAAASVTNWNLFTRLVDRHRVIPLAQDALARADVVLPAVVERRIAARAAQCAVTALAMARESVRLQEAFRVAGLPALIIKGTPLGVLAYGDPCMKQSWDIDLLTSAEVLTEAHSLLEALGYDRRSPERLTAEEFRCFAQFAIEAAYVHRVSGLTVELHWGLTRNRRLLPKVDVKSSTQVVRIAGAELLTFADDILFSYLCVHGTLHAWARLKWLADLAAFISTHDLGDVERMYGAALDAGAGRAPAASLLLCRHLFEVRIPPLVRDVGSGRLVRYFESLALERIKATKPPEHLSAFERARVNFSLFLVAPGLRFIAEQLRNIWLVPIERARFGSAAHLLRFPLWLIRIAQGLMRRHTPQPSGGSPND